MRGDTPGLYVRQAGQFHQWGTLGPGYHGAVGHVFSPGSDPEPAPSLTAL